jgi:hypothetical protein
MSSPLPRLLALAALALAPASGLVGCGGDPAAPSDFVSGTYDLETVNGFEPPVTVFADVDYELEVLDSRTTLELDGSFTSSLTLRETDGSDVSTGTSTSRGTYRLTGTTLSLQVPGDPQSPYSGSLQGEDLTLNIAGIIYRYREIDSP